MTGVWPAVLRQPKDIRQNGIAKPQSAALTAPFKRSLRRALSVSCADSSPGGRAKSPLLKEGGRRSLTGVWPAVLRQHKNIRQNGIAKPQSPYGRQLLSKGALDTAGDS